VSRLRAISSQPLSSASIPSYVKPAAFDPSFFSNSGILSLSENDGDTTQHLAKFTNVVGEGSGAAAGGQSTGEGGLGMKIFNYYNEHVREPFEGVAGVVVEGLENVGKELPNGIKTSNSGVQNLGDALDALNLIVETHEVATNLKEIQDCIENPQIPYFSEEDKQRAENALKDAAIDSFSDMITKAAVTGFTKVNVGLGKIGEVILLPVTKLGEKVFGDAVKQDLGVAQKLVGDTSKCHPHSPPSSSNEFKGCRPGWRQLPDGTCELPAWPVG
jgi:hypothetical protein